MQKQSNIALINSQTVVLQAQSVDQTQQQIQNTSNSGTQDDLVEGLKEFDVFEKLSKVENGNQAYASSDIYDALQKELEETTIHIKTNETIIGTITSIEKGAIVVNIGTKKPATCFLKDITSAPITQAREAVTVNTQRRFKIIRGRNMADNIFLSLKDNEDKAAWERLKQLQELMIQVPAVVQSFNNGGMTVSFIGKVGFIPWSQALNSIQEGSQLVGKTIRGLIRELKKEPGFNTDFLFNQTMIAFKADVQKIKANKIVFGKIVDVTRAGVIVQIKDTQIKALLPMAQITKKSLTLDINAVMQIFQIGEEIKAYITALNHINGQVLISTKVLEVAVGQILTDKKGVFDNAELYASVTTNMIQRQLSQPSISMEKQQQQMIRPKEVY